MALPENNACRRSYHWGRSWFASEAGPLFNQSSWSVSPLSRTSAAKAREASAMSLGISGYKMSQSLVKRDEKLVSVYSGIIITDTILFARWVKPRPET